MILRINRIHTEHLLVPGADVSLAGPPAHYLSRVLRLSTGQRIVLFNGDGHDYPSEIIRVSKNKVDLSVGERVDARSESPLNITLVQALGRGERMDTSLQKCTELGVATFQPLITQRVELRLRPDKLAKRMLHWRRVVISACEQCGRATVPPVYEPLALGDWLAESTTAMRLVLEPGSGTSLAAAQIESAVELLAGPEGGFTDSELGLLQSAGVEAVSLGPRILRTETAGPAAVTVLQTVAGDFG